MSTSFCAVEVQTVDPYGNAFVKKPGTLLGGAGVLYSKQQVSGAKALDSKVTADISTTSPRMLEFQL
eukprot:5381858-Amphidinium_carterae.1